MPRGSNSRRSAPIVDMEEVDGEKRCVHCGEVSPRLLFLDKSLKPVETDLFCRLEGSIESLMKHAEYRTPSGKLKLADLQYKKIAVWLANMKAKYQRTLEQGDIDTLHDQVRKLIDVHSSAREKTTGEVSADPVDANGDKLPTPGPYTQTPLQRKPYRNRIGKHRTKINDDDQQCQTCNAWVTGIEMRGKNESRTQIKKCIECRTYRFIWMRVRQQRGNPKISSRKLLESVTDLALESLIVWEKGLNAKHIDVPAATMRALRAAVHEEVRNRVSRETGSGNFRATPDRDVAMGSSNGSNGDETESDLSNLQQNNGVYDDLSSNSSSDLSDPPSDDEDEDGDVEMTSLVSVASSEPSLVVDEEPFKGKLRLRNAAISVVDAPMDVDESDLEADEPITKNKTQMVPLNDIEAAEAVEPIPPAGSSRRAKSAASEPELPDHSPGSWATSMVRMTTELRNAQTIMTTEEFTKLVGEMRHSDYYDPDKVIAKIDEALAQR